MSIYKYDKSGYSGQSYDRNVFEANLSTVNKIQRDFWTAKQVIRKKLGKQDDDCIISSDSEIDAKLELFESIQKTCVDLIKLIKKYQQCICSLSRDENSMGRFLKDQGGLDKTPAGKLMGAMGKAQCFTSQQRLNMRNSLSRLHHDVETFRYRAIGDCLLTINNMEEARTHYRASLRWMQDISANLDPEQYKKLEKFRKVQTEVRLNKEKFDRLKWAVCQKVDLLSASRTNLFSATLVPYQTELIKFWEKSSNCLAAVYENIKDHKHYEFKLLKDLNPLTDDNDAQTKSPESNINCKDDDELINLQESKVESPAAVEEANTNNLPEDLLTGFDESNLINPQKESIKSSNEEDDDALLNDLLGNEDATEFEKQWESVFGEFKQASDVENEVKSSLSLENLLLIDGDEAKKQTSPLEEENMRIESKNITNSGYLPSQLLDMMQTAGDQQANLHQTTNINSIQSSYSNLPPFFGMQPPNYSESSKSRSNFPQSSQPLPTKADKNPSSKSAWYDLFAELDPLQNPDALGKVKDSDKIRRATDGGSC